MELVFNSLTNNTNQTALNLFLSSKIRIEHTDLMNSNMVDISLTV